MCRIWLSNNGEAQHSAILPGESWTVELDASEGLCMVTAWAQTGAVSILVLDDRFSPLAEACGAVVTAQVILERRTVLTVVLSARRRLISKQEENLLSAVPMLISSIHDVATEDEAFAILCAASLSHAVPTFSEGNHFFCVAKRKLACSSKKIPLPNVTKRMSAIEVLQIVREGKCEWKQSSGSFSNLMRFVQKSKEKFHWDARDEAALPNSEIVCSP